jgi:hypothetical protein
MQNIRSHERTFQSIFFGGTNASRRQRTALLLGGFALVLLLCGNACLPNTQDREAGQLLDRLAAARAGLAASPPVLGATCDDIADVKSRLLGEPGLVNLASWSSLRDAADALQAVCGQATLLAVSVSDAASSPAVLTARVRWQQGLARELDLACEDMRQGAAALARTSPC